MIGFRTKFFFLLMVYFAGFATAVYVLSPTPGGEDGVPGQAKGFKGALNSERFTQAINTGMHKCVDLGKDIADRTSVIIREKLEELQANQGASDHS